jgi:hypothetical protein
MDRDPRHLLFDPPAAHRMVLARRPPRASAVVGVVSDVVWRDVVGLLRWATADTHGAGGLDMGRWWRLAAACADLLRRLPGLVDELAEPSVGDLPDDPLRGEESVATAADRLAALLVSVEPVPLRRLAVEVDALGAAAIAALARQGPWAGPTAAR